MGSGPEPPLAIMPTAYVCDLIIPKGYSQMKRSEQVAYWLAAVEKEYAGLIANGTWESMRVVDLPTGANVVNCHLVFTIKRKSAP